MAEQTEEQGGSVVLPGVVGLAAGYGAKKVYDSGANSLVKTALGVGAEGAKPAAAALVTAAEKSVDAKFNLQGVADLSKVKAEAVTGVSVTKAVGESAKGFDVVVSQGSQSTTLKGVNKLPSDLSKLVGDSASKTIAGDELASLNKNGGWVGKLTKTAEKETLGAVRSSKAWKEAGGGLKATFGHMGGAGKTGLVVGTVAAVGGLGIAVKNMFSGPSHTSRVEAERSAQTQAQPAR